jgi:uncharacterized protein YdeI (YjbR/CyaY-like superfamily)
MATRRKLDLAAAVVGTRDRGEPIVSFDDVASWDAWLAAAHAEHGPVWLRLAKKGNGDSTLTYLEAVERGLCWGWIDSQKGALDARWFVQRFSRRSAKSPWSQVNRASAERLIASGEMRAAGLAEVERARADGRWERAYAPASKNAIPPELEAALGAARGARARFDVLDATNRYALCFRVHAPKQAATRERKAKELVAALLRGETPYPKREPKVGTTTKATISSDREPDTVAGSPTPQRPRRSAAQSARGRVKA